MAFWKSGLMVFLRKMYIEINEDIIKDAIEKGNGGENLSLDLLYLFAFSAMKGNHIIYVPCLYNNQNLRSDLSTVLPKRILAMLVTSDRIHYQLGIIKKKVSTYALVTYSKNKPDNKAILINPTLQRGFEPYSACRVLTEHINDSSFFRYLVQFYLKYDGVGNCRINFEPLMGGGSTTADILRREIFECRHFCLVIVDSDKKYPTAPKGDTSTKIENAMNFYKPFNCYHYVMKEVMEVENLIPKKILGIIAPNQGYNNIFNYDWSYYDMKSGLTIKGLYDDTLCDYWKNLLRNEHLDFTERDLAKANSQNKDAFENYVNNNNLKNQILKGFGTNLLATCDCCPKIDGTISHPEVKHELYNIKKEDLTNQQYSEWMEIGKIMFTWACGMGIRRS